MRAHLARESLIETRRGSLRSKARKPQNREPRCARQSCGRLSASLRSPSREARAGDAPLARPSKTKGEMYFALKKYFQEFEKHPTQA